MLDTTCSILPGAYLVISWLDGRVAFAVRDREISARAMADLLLRIHAIPAGPELSFLAQQGHPLDALARAADTIGETAEFERCRDLLDDCDPSARAELGLS